MSLREPKRESDLLRAILDESDGWIASDDDLDALLPPDSRIVPSGIAKRLWSPETNAEPADVLIAVAVNAGASERNYQRDEKAFTVTVDVGATTEWIENDGEGSIHDLTDIRDRVAVLLTQHRDLWEAVGQSGGTEGITPDDERDRYGGVSVFEFARDDAHKVHE